MRYDFYPPGGAALHEALRARPYPEDRTEERLEQWVAPALRAHVKDFLRCAQTRERPVADIEQGYQSTTACLLANVAMKLGRTLEWDPREAQVVGDARPRAAAPPVSRALGAP